MRRLTDVAVDDALPEVAFEATNLNVFLLGAAYWTSHRIHYDRQQAIAEGFADVVATGTLLYAWVENCVAAWAGGRQAIRSLRFRNTGLVLVGDTVVVGGRVTEVADDGDVSCALTMRTAAGDAVLEAHALVALP